MDKIIIHENFLDDNEIQKAIEIVDKKNTWSWGHNSLGKHPYETQFWHLDLCEEEFYSIYLKKIIEKTFQKKFRLNRVYATGQTFGQEGTYHQDSEKENDYTFCLYLSNISNPYIETAGGHLFFKFDDIPYKIGYEPIFNRGIFFPSNYFHKGVSFSRFIMTLRICVAWKLEEIV